MQKFTVEETYGIRLDDYLKEKLSMSRSSVQKLIQNSTVLVNDQKTKNSYLVKENDCITVLDYEKEVMDLIPEKLDIPILYEDSDVMVINKPNGMVVHPAAGNFHGTVVNGLLDHSLSSMNGMFRPGIVHRIDAYTTGLLMIAKNDLAHQFLAEQLKEHTITRKYVALVWGVISNDTGTIDAPIGRDKKDRKKMAVVAHGKHAVTHFRVLKRYSEVTFIELQLETGRTHQIRVHMNYIGYPIVNDPVYGKKTLLDDSGQCLHAKTIGFIHPTSKQYMEFCCELPVCFENILRKFVS